MPKISIIIPVYNTQAYLPKCLDSVFSQTFQDFEVIVVNDGSPDDSQSVIDRYQEKYPDKLVALKQENAGLAAARNTGINAASGEYVAFLDSDDYLHPETLEKTYTYALAQALDIVCFRYYSDCEGVITAIPSHSAQTDDPVKRFILNDGSATNKLFRRELFTQTGLRFTPGLFYEDIDLIPRLSLHTQRIGFLDVPLYYYFTRDGSIMRLQKYNPKLNSIFTVMEHLRDAFQNSPYTQELECLHIVHFLHDAALRFLPYPEGKESILQIVQIMRKHFPRWQKNKYYQTYGIKFKTVCMLIYYKQFALLKLLLKR